MPGRLKVRIEITKVVRAPAPGRPTTALERVAMPEPFPHDCPSLQTDATGDLQGSHDDIDRVIYL